jgi:CHRD domain
MRRIGLFAALLAAVIVVLGVSSAIADSGKKHLKAGDLTGLEENPDISTVAGGSFEITLDDDARTLSYELSYAGLEGTVLQAHIHFGKRAVNGGITLFLCGTAGSPGPAGTPVCPQSGTVSRTVSAADILAPGTQGIEAGNYEELAAALRSGHAYANVHSSKWPGGEIRAQINDQDEDD